MTVRFAIGYQLSEEDEEPFLDLVRDYRQHIAEVYFPWADMPSGRAPLTTRRGFTDWTAQGRLENDLRALRELGVKLDILFNANCYGRHAASTYLENQVGSLLQHLEDIVGGVDTVTTTSLTVARTVKQYFPQVDVRASVNMRIGTVKGMQYLSELFDSFQVQRDYNRDLEYLGELKDWADSAGKRLHLLANSGCMAFCSGQVFHDNMVAHEAEIDETRNIEGWNPHACWNYLRNREHWVSVLQNTWIRPEDLHHYEGLFDQVKLATRMHSRPRMVVRAYATRRFRGNLLDLFEPGFSPALAPYIIDNERFPEDWFERTSTCSRQCHRCGYCESVLEQVLVKMEA